ncbi:MAG: FAD-dependent oxidoreductase [Bryobacteraceae bacterium]|nr:FAD-dependent oxidoreductase [Bryobacteraceae bacterium]
MHCLIAGAGLIGASLAWRLGQRGHSVTLADAGTFCGEASHAGAGMLSPEGERFPDAIWAERAQQSLALYPGFIDELKRESGLAIDYDVCGAQEDGRHFPNEAIVDPRDLARALRQALARYRVEVVEHQRLSALTYSPEGVQSGRFRADAAVVAAGAWSSQLQVNGAALPESIPVKGYLLGYHGAPKLGPIRRDGHTYILQRTNGYTIAGSTEETMGFSRDIDPARVADLHRRAAGLWPPLANLAPADVWTGLRPSTATGRIYTERWGAAPVWLAYGHYRNGILLAPWTAEYLADQIQRQ